MLCHRRHAMLLQDEDDLETAKIASMPRRRGRINAMFDARSADMTEGTRGTTFALSFFRLSFPVLYGRGVDSTEPNACQMPAKCLPNACAMHATLLFRSRSDIIGL